MIFLPLLLASASIVQAEIEPELIPRDTDWSQIIKRDDLPVANYTCEGVHYLPDKGCYPEAYRGNTSVPQAWGVYLDSVPNQISAVALGNLADTCASALNAMCIYVNNHLNDSSVRDQWIWQMSAGPGCVVAIYLPEANHVPEPLYADCAAHIALPMRKVLVNGPGDNKSRVSINIQNFPSLPDLASLTKTILGGPMPFEVSDTGMNINTSISSWMARAYTYIP